MGPNSLMVVCICGPSGIAIIIEIHSTTRPKVPASRMAFPGLAVLWASAKVPDLITMTGQQYYLLYTHVRVT